MNDVSRALNVWGTGAFETVSAGWCCAGGSGPCGGVGCPALQTVIAGRWLGSCICLVSGDTYAPCKVGDLLSAGKALAFAGDLCSSLQLAPQVIENNCYELLL